jgi:hypothetical protein
LKTTATRIIFNKRSFGLFVVSIGFSMSSAFAQEEKSMVKDFLALTNLNDTIPEPKEKYSGC